MSNPNELLSYGEFGKKKRVNSKTKGSNFERACAKKFNGRFNTKEFCRTPGSGAFGTTHKNLPQYLKVQGDLITPENFKFIIECKTGYDIRLEDFWKPKSDLWSFIKQAKRESAADGRPWLIIYKRTRQPEMLFCEHEFPVKAHLDFKDGIKVYPFKEVLSLPAELFFS
jgi:hypothetical protein